MALGEPDANVAREAWSGFFRLMTSEANRQRVAGICEHFGITPGQMKALVTMGGRARPMKELAVEWHCDASYVTVLVDDLEEPRMGRAPGPPRRPAVAGGGGHPRRRTGPRASSSSAWASHRPSSPPLTEAEQRTMRDILGKLLAAAGEGPH